MGSTVKEEKVIDDIQLNNRGEYLRVTKGEYSNDNMFIDIRKMFTNTDGEKCYTQKGIRVNNELVPELIGLMLKALPVETVIDIEEKCSSIIDEAGEDNSDE